jgi:hypothetical protein
LRVAAKEPGSDEEQTIEPSFRVPYTMTIFFTDQERRRRKKVSTPKAADQYPSAQTSQSSQSYVHSQEQYYAPSASVIETQPPHGYTTNSPPPLYSYSPPQSQYLIYGPTPQMPQRYGKSHATAPSRPTQQYIGDSTLNFASPPKENENLLRAQWDRAGRLASKSCDNLSNQISSSASKSVTMISNSVDKSVDATSRGVTMVTTNLIVKPTTMATSKSVQTLNQGAALCDRISDKFDAVMTSIDVGLFSGNEQDLHIYEDQTHHASAAIIPPSISRDRLSNANTPSCSNHSKGSNFFSKVWLYSNSRLPPHLPPFKVYIPTYRLICLAAKYSERAYNDPTASRSETETHVPADWRSGTKAMVLKSLPIDDMNTIVFAIRGSQTFMDWAVNYRTEPSSPEGFLDDAGNLCHAGFLYVARKMVKPVADRLRVLLEENPSRSNASLLITGHSAGGAVAALLFAHMMNVEVQSDLSYLTGFFKRVHCVTFGAPPVSLLPLKKSHDKQHKKSLFYSFINEGDPVPRIDRAVFKSLVKLFSSPAPNYSCVSSLASLSVLNHNASQNTVQTTSTGKSRKKTSKPSKTSLKTTSTGVITASLPTYPIAPGSLSPAGRLIVLRKKPGSRSVNRDEDIEAVTVEDEIMRNIVYGDPMMHVMKLYKKRVESIATKAVTGADW